MKALAGTRILDLTHMVSGPYCTQMLADSGAEVIKIEAPRYGEATRRLLENDPKLSIEKMGAYFLTLGRNKKSMTLDLKKEEGIEVFHQLVKISDVVIYNFRAGVGDKLGLSYEHLKELNPKIITCSITGFGETGPNSDRTSFDLVAQASGGSMFVTHGDEPYRAGVPIGDLGGGLMGAIGVLTALQARHNTGRGQHIDISMQDAQISLLNYMATSYFLSGESPPPIGNSHFAFVPYGTYKVKDGYIIVAIITDQLWEDLMAVMELPEIHLEENRTKEGRLINKEKINQVLGDALLEQDSEYWIKLLSGKGIPCGPVHNLAGALNDPHVLARNMVVEVEHPSGKKVKQVGNPIKMSETFEETYNSPPLLGADTNDILTGLLGFNDAEIDALENRGVTG